ncbi:TolC family protein [Rubinisphaera sp. JC750]|uniref:TolC family protein n=1 Tax=Rubinisphaera sp. JC750 TaxID=2898658 RepID=UPI001F3CCE6E|nr:TolC family protein [Rubinisphaera sp. JC750]
MNAHFQIACLLFFGLAGTAVEAEEEASKRLRHLLVEKHETLQTISKQVIQAFQTGKASFEQVYRAKQAVLNSELALTEDMQARIEILEQHVALAKQFEENTARSFQLGETTQDAVLKARLDRLDAEISLVKAQHQLRD